MNKDNPLIQKFLSLNLPKDNYAIFGSGPMFAVGLKDLGHDIDVIANKEAWEEAKTLGDSKPTKSGNGQVVELFDGEIEIFNSWGPGEWDTNDLIKTADEIEGIKFVELEKVLEWKQIMNRDKDKEHIRLIKEYLR